MHAKRPHRITGATAAVAVLAAAISLMLGMSVDPADAAGGPASPQAWALAPAVAALFVQTL